jgi:DNA-binding MarR family transcriptional regulator
MRRMARRDSLRRVEQSLISISRIGNGREAARIRSERSGVHISRPSVSVLMALRTGGPVRLSQLSRRTDLEAPLISREVRDLAAAGLVERAADPTDGRAAIVALTATGLRTIETYLAGADEIFDETFRAWSAADLKTLADLLDRVAADFRRTPAREPVRN